MRASRRRRSRRSQMSCQIPPSCFHCLPTTLVSRSRRSRCRTRNRQTPSRGRRRCRSHQMHTTGTSRCRCWYTARCLPTTATATAVGAKGRCFHCLPTTRVSRSRRSRCRTRNRHTPSRGRRRRTCRRLQTRGCRCRCPDTAKRWASPFRATLSRPPVPRERSMSRWKNAGKLRSSTAALHHANGWGSDIFLCRSGMRARRMPMQEPRMLALALRCSAVGRTEHADQRAQDRGAWRGHVCRRGAEVFW